ncbi:MAG: hypothetical protein JWM66_120 [Solirubrobacterales bacterium]|nr:hypothetical protein [Solirubrobacterales bacterium]
MCDGPLLDLKPTRPTPRAGLLRHRPVSIPQVLRTITLHECPRTFASLMIAGNVNAKALSTYIGHAQR